MGRNGLLDASYPSSQRRYGSIRYVNLLINILFFILIAGCAHVGFEDRVEDSLSAREHFNLGSIYEKRGELELALREYELALNRHSHFLPAMTRVGELSYQIGQYQKAEKYYRKAIKMAPRNGDLYNNLCWVYLSQGRKLKKAESLIMMAMELTPEHKGYYLDTLGTIYLKQQRYWEATSVLEAAIPLFDETQLSLLSQLYQHLGLAYDAMGERPKAEEAFKKARDALDR